MQGWEERGNYINMRSKICSNNVLGTLMFIARTEWQMTENIITSSQTPHHYYHHYNPIFFFSTNWDHPLQSVRRQVQRSPLRGHHVWGLQGRPHNDKKASFHIHYLLPGFLPAFPVQCDQLPVSPAEELRGGQSEQEPVPVLPPPEVHGARHVERWWVQSLYSEEHQLINHQNLCSQCSVMIDNELIECDLWKQKSTPFLPHKEFPSRLICFKQIMAHIWNKLPI